MSSDIIGDTDNFSPLEIIAMTAIGESETLGVIGMHQTINTIMNRAAADLTWMGGNDPRQVCLKENQYDCWWPQSHNEDRSRILAIGTQNPTYGPYITALKLAESALVGTLPDITNGAVSYGDAGARPKVHSGSEPCLVVGQRVFYDLTAVA